MCVDDPAGEVSCSEKVVAHLLLYGSSRSLTLMQEIICIARVENVLDRCVRRQEGHFLLLLFERPDLVANVAEELNFIFHVDHWKIGAQPADIERRLSVFVIHELVFGLQGFAVLDEALGVGFLDVVEQRPRLDRLNQFFISLLLFRQLEDLTQFCMLCFPFRFELVGKIFKLLNIGLASLVKDDDIVMGNLLK